MKKALFITALRPASIQADEAILRKSFDVHSFLFRYGRFWRVLLSEIHLTAWLLCHIWTAELCWIWFADYHSLIPALLCRLLGRCVVIGIGGYDAANEPGLNYGAHLRRFRGWCVRKSCDWASVLAPVSEFTGREIARYTHTPQEVIYPGVDTEFWTPGPSMRHAMCVTVCGCDDLVTFSRKGIDLFIAVARRLPYIEFRIIGLTGDARWRQDLPSLPNLFYMCRMRREELRVYYRIARVYCQFSRYEAFGVALVEAMACGCFPVVLMRGGMPEVVGGDGLVLDTENPGEIARTIKRIMEQGTGHAFPRQAVLESFSIERRERELGEMVKGGA